MAQLEEYVVHTHAKVISFLGLILVFGFFFFSYSRGGGGGGETKKIFIIDERINYLFFFCLSMLGLARGGWEARDETSKL